jgi:hypothetical protein
MATDSPRPISPAQLRLRRHRIAAIASSLGFIGKVDYRHVYSQTGGAQYGRGTTEMEDVLTVYAEAFERDEDPEDFSLEAMIAHEQGHQILARHPRLAPRVVGLSTGSEEILASLLGAMMCHQEKDRVMLYAKATAELLEVGQSAEQATSRLQELWDLLVRLL